MDAFFFGHPDSSLYGVYHPAAASQDLQHGIVLCNALGQEYMRSHRSYTFLAGRLAAAGFHVLRFDYYGTGDSDGDMDIASITHWLENIHTAAGELRDYTGIRKISLAGLRLGAALAVMAGAEKNCFERIVLWEPVISGEDYLREIRDMHKAWIKDLQPRPPAEHLKPPGMEIIGFPCPPTLQQEMESINLLETNTRPASAMLLVGASPDKRYQKLQGHLSKLGAVCDARFFDEAATWQKRSDMNSILVPNSVLSSITTWLSEVA